MNRILILYVTHSSEEQAQNMVTQLVNERLIACGNIFPITSTYVYNQQLCCEGEVVSLMKTGLTLAKTVTQRIEDLHPYDVPCILQSEVCCNEGYAAWVAEQTTNESS